MVEVNPSANTTETSCTSTAKRQKRTKRARSPLLELEEGVAAIQPNSGGFTGDIMEISSQSPEFMRITWRKKHLEIHRNSLVFQDNRNLPEQFNEFKTPYQFFKYKNFASICWKISMKIRNSSDVLFGPMKNYFQ